MKTIHVDLPDDAEVFCLGWPCPCKEGTICAINYKDRTMTHRVGINRVEHRMPGKAFVIRIEEVAPDAV